MKARFLAVVSSLVILTAIGCGKPKKTLSPVCFSYCDFLSQEHTEETSAENDVLAFGGAHDTSHATNDAEAKALGEQAHDRCVHLHEALARRQAAAHAIARAPGIVSTRASTTLGPPEDDHAPDCRTVSPAQLRAFAVDYEARLAKMRQPFDEGACQLTCTSDLEQKTTPH